MNYLDNLEDTMIKANRKALAMKDGRAWNNRKTKTMRKCLPRGKAFWKIHNLERSKSISQIMSRWVSF